MSNRQLWIAIIAIAFVLRAMWALLMPIHPVSDGDAYDELAWNLASKGAYMWDTGKMTAFWPVGTSFLYSLFFRVFGHDYAPIAAFNVLLGTATVPLIIALGQRWVSTEAGLIAGGLFALWPMQIEFTSILASELIFNFLVLLALWLALEVRFQSMALRAVVVGALLAAASYVRAQALLFPFIFALAMVWRHRAKWRELGLFAVVSALTMAACIAPWTLRNLHVLGAPVLISDNSGSAAFAGNQPGSTGECCVPLPADVEALPEPEMNRELGERAKAWAREHPGDAARLFVRKLYSTHNRETMGIVWNRQSLSRYLSPAGIAGAKLVSSLYWLGALVLGAIGALLVLWRERWRGLIHPAIMIWAYFALVHAVVQASDRYHLPSVPFIAILAGLAMTEAWRRWLSRDPSRRPAEAVAGQ